MSFNDSIDDIVAQNHNGLLGARSHWQRARLGTFATILNGFPFDSSRFSTQSGTPLLRIRDIMRGRTDTLVDQTAGPEYLVQPGEIVVGMDGDFNCARWRGHPAFLNQRVCKITPDPNRYDARFLAHVLPGYLQAINEHTPSVTVKHLSSRTVADIPLPIPCLHEQQQVADHLDEQLSKLEAGEAALKRAQANLKRYRASVLNAAVEGRLVPTEAELARAQDRDFECASRMLQRVHDERAATPARPQPKRQTHQAPATPTLPEGWAWSTIAEVCERVTVGFVGPMKHEYTASGVPFLRSQNIRENRFDPTGLLYISPRFHQQISKSTIMPGDLAVVRSGSVGVTCVIPDHLAEANCSDLVLIQRPLGIEPQFCAFYMNSIAKTYVQAGKVGVALTHFNTASVASLPIPVPPTMEQQRIVAEAERLLSEADTLEQTMDETLRQTRQLRRAALSQAFSAPPCEAAE